MSYREVPLNAGFRMRLYGYGMLGPEVPDYGTSLHYAACLGRPCTGCVPDAPVIQWNWGTGFKRRAFDPSIFRKAGMS